MAAGSIEGGEFRLPFFGGELSRDRIGTSTDFDFAASVFAFSDPEELARWLRGTLRDAGADLGASAMSALGASSGR